MRYWKAGLSIAGIIWFVLMGGALFWNLAPSENILGLPTSAAASAGAHLPGSLGKNRHQVLVEATRLYRRSGMQVSQSTAEVSEFAPVPFLNRELARQGAKWRVRSTEGLDAEVYEIS